MEDITSYSFTGSNDEKVNVVVRYGDNKVVWYYNGVPEQVKDAATLRDRFSSKSYDRLFVSNQNILDFLNARLGG